MGCGTGCGRVILVLLNLLILLVSMAILALGILLKFFPGAVTTILAGTTAALSQSTKTSFNIPNVSEITDLPFLDQVGVALIVFGAVLLCISFFACCGACYQFRPLLILFVIVMCILVIGQAVIGGLFLARDSVLHQKIKEVVGSKVKADFKTDGKDAFSYSINILNYLLKCCGIRDWNDFNNFKPASCCNRTIIDGDTSWDVRKLQCTSNPPTAPDSYYNPQGCYAVLQDAVQSNLIIAAIILSAILFVQFLEIVFACMIVHDVNNKVGPV